MRQFVLSSGQEEAGRAEALLQQLNRSQQTAVESLDGPLMIVAGAGSGKTRTLTYRIAYLLASGHARPDQILALTFTNKAAREMVDRIVSLVGQDAVKGLWMGTFHSIFARLLRREAEHLGYTRDYTIYDSEDSERVVKLLLRRHGIDERQFTPRSVRNAISRAKNSMLDVAAMERRASSFFEEKVVQVYRPYEEELRKSNAMDFDDLLLNPIRLFDQHPDILQKYQARWRYIHIDEYQDTNKAQYAVAAKLSRRHGNLCVVGDDAQSIYAFRGADIANILNFEKDHDPVTIVRLEQNYRSTKRILQLADSVIKHNRQQITKTLWTDNPEGEFVVAIEALSERDEAQKLQRTVRDLQLRDGYGYGDFAILYRTNAQSRALEDAFRRAGIPYEIIGGVNFYQRREIKDALGYLRLIVNPNDNEALRRVINYPTRGIGRKTLDHLEKAARSSGDSVWETVSRVEELGLSARATKAVSAFRDMIEGYRSRVEDVPADELTRSIINDAGILADLRNENTIEGLARWENVQELISAVAEFVEGSEQPTLSAFLQEVSLYTSIDQEQQDDRVKLMTVHASKGLEFPVVFLPGLEEGLFPLQGPDSNIADVEEERRLLYVGITRARQRLFLSCARTRFRYGQSHAATPSRFLDEMDRSVIISEAHQPLDRDETFRHAAHYERELADRSRGRQPSPGRPFDEASVADTAEVVPGVRVEHKLFGNGKVLQVEGSGDQKRATVFFKRVGQKRLVLKFAKLKKID